MSMSTRTARHAPHARAARERTCATCLHACREGSRRRERCERNGSCAQWARRPAERSWKDEIPGWMFTNKARNPILATRPDGRWRAWKSVTEAAAELGVPACRVTSLASRHGVLDGWRITYLKESVNR
uniref:Uncharacterized protein n=1 Tax=uncultured bacterium Contig1770 TaxID=1393510 RepID=W0FN74_9BACT|nr:hypothetical protein [uncultured bacterium Contig1770]